MTRISSGPRRRNVLFGMLGATGLAGAGGVSGARGAGRGRALAEPEDFDFDTGNAIRDLMFAGDFILREPVAAMDVSLIIRVTTSRRTRGSTRWRPTTPRRSACTPGSAAARRVSGRPTGSGTSRSSTPPSGCWRSCCRR